MLPDIETLHASRWVWSFLSFAFVIGLFSMVVLQVLRTLFPWRVWYQSSWMRRWMEKGLGRFMLLWAKCGFAG
jgi:hypothetical protein